VGCRHDLVADTGGAGYIGSHIVRAFAAAEIGCVVIDDLSNGHREFVDAEVPFYGGSVLDRALLDRILTEHPVTGVVPAIP
jgi:UDP-glucose 4-epimerase